MGEIKVDSKRWKIGKNDPKRLKEGIAIMRQALENEEEERNRKSRLPPDWRNRIITN